MAGWQTLGTSPDESAVTRDFGELWRGADKVVYSTTLDEVSTPRTRLERNFDPDVVRALVARSDVTCSSAGPGLAAHALRAGLVDEIGVVVAPVVVGGGTPGCLPGLASRPAAARRAPVRQRVRRACATPSAAEATTAPSPPPVRTGAPPRRTSGIMIRPAESGPKRPFLADLLPLAYAADHATLWRTPAARAWDPGASHRAVVRLARAQHGPRRCRPTRSSRTSAIRSTTTVSRPLLSHDIGNVLDVSDWIHVTCTWCSRTRTPRSTRAAATWHPLHPQPLPGRAAAG